MHFHILFIRRTQNWYDRFTEISWKQKLVYAIIKFVEFQVLGNR